MGSLKVKIFEEGPDTLVWNIALEFNLVKSNNIGKLNSKNALGILSQLFTDYNNLNQNNAESSVDLNQNNAGQDNKKSPDHSYSSCHSNHEPEVNKQLTGSADKDFHDKKKFCGEFVYNIVGMKNDDMKLREKETVLDFLTFELESRQNEKFTFECKKCHAFSSGTALVFPSNRQQEICENCENNLAPKNIRLDHSYCHDFHDDFEIDEVETKVCLHFLVTI